MADRLTKANIIVNGDNERRDEVTVDDFSGDGGEVVTQEQQDLATKNRLRKYSKKRMLAVANKCFN